MRAAAIVSLLAMEISALAESPAEQARATVKIYVQGNVSHRGLNMHWAESVASEIFAEAGVHINWQPGEPNRGEQYMPIIISVTSNTPKELAPGALAFAQVYEGVHISVFWERVRDIAGGAYRLATFNRPATFLLAHVMAHEITHILEGVNRHSETGLMKASWTDMEIEQMSVRHLALTPEDVRLIHDGLLKRATRHVAGSVDYR